MKADRAHEGLLARTREHDFFASPAWPQLLQRCGVQLAPFRGQA